MEKSAYLVTAKCGHVGRGKFIEITFPIAANTKKEAALITRNRGRVKHHWSDAIISVEQVDWNAYQEQKNKNQRDPYLNIFNSSQQKMFDEIIKSRTEVQFQDTERDPFERKQRALYKRKRVFEVMKYSSGDVFA